MDAFKTLIPMYLTARENPQYLKKNMHQALALMIYKNINGRKLELENFMYFREWLNDSYYHRKLAIQTALKIRQYFYLRNEYKQCESGGRFWRRLKLKYLLYILTYQGISVCEILNYACYLFMDCKCGNENDFIAFLQNVQQNPELYFKQ